MVRRPGRSVWVVVTALLLLFGALQLGPVAAAATIDGGALGDGASVSTPTVAGDEVRYTAEVPAGRRLVLRGSTGAGLSRAGFLISDATGQVASGTFGAYGSTSAFVEAPSTGVDRTLQVTVTVQSDGNLAFTSTFVPDVGPTDMTFSTPVRASIDVPGQQALFTLTGQAGKRLAMTVSDSTFSPPFAGRASVSGPGLPESGLAIGATTPGWIMTDGTYTVRLDGVAEAIGAVTLRADAVEDLVGTSGLGADETLEFSTVWTQYEKRFTHVPGARLRLDVLASSLVDTLNPALPGSASVFYDDGDGLTTFAFIRNQTMTVVSPFVWSDASPGRVVIRPDGRTTGSVTLRFSALVDNPAVPLNLGASVAVPFDTPYYSRSYSFEAAAASRVRIDLEDISLASASAPGSSYLAISLIDADTEIGVASWITFSGATTWTTELDLSLYTSSGGGRWILRIDPNDDSVGSAVLRLTGIADVLRPLDVGVPVTATTDGNAPALVFTNAGGADAALPSITVDAVDLRDRSGNVVAPSARFDQQGLSYGGSWVLGQVSAGLTFQPPSDLDPTRPWSLNVAVGLGTTGSLTVSLREPTTTTRTIAVGSATPVDFRTLGDVTELRLVPVVGRRVVVTQANPTTSVAMELFNLAGERIGVGTDSGYLEVAAPTSSEPLLLRTFLAGNPARIGRADISVTQVRYPRFTFHGATRINWAAGQNPIGRFEATKGRRLTFDIIQSSWTPGTESVNTSITDLTGGWMTGFGTLVAPGATFIDLAEPVTRSGTYTLTLDPSAASAGRMTMRVSQVQDVVRDTRLGVRTTVPLLDPGQKAYLTVRVREGAQLAWTGDFGGMTGSLSLLGTGSQWGNIAEFSPTGTLGTGPLAAGTYTLVIDPTAKSTGRVTLTLRAV